MVRNIQDFFRKGTVLPVALTIGAIMIMITIVGLRANPISAIPQVDIRTEPQKGIMIVGETFDVTLIITSSISVNAFEGELLFDSTVLAVESIHYNTSIADLWVQEPWYSNGDGTINFAGGTTHKGGFIGTDTLITITFKSIAEGSGYVDIKKARILKHDGLGTDALVQKSVDSIFTVESPKNTIYNIPHTDTVRNTSVIVQKRKPTTDLNGDGKQNIADLSIFMLHLAQQNPRSDFNGDGHINTADLSIILNLE